MTRRGTRAKFLESGVRVRGGWLSGQRPPTRWSRLRPRLPPELLLDRLRHEVHHRRVVRHAVELETMVKLLGDAVANCVSGSSVFAIKPPCSSTQVDDWDHNRAALRRRGDYEKTQTGARGAAGP